MSSYLHDLAAQTVGGLSIVPVALTTAASPVNGTAVDLIATQGTCFAMEFAGVYTSPGTWDCKIQEAIEDPANLGNPLSTDWSDVVTIQSPPVAQGAAAFPQVIASGVAPLGFAIIIFQRTKRFCRAVNTLAGGGGSVLGAVFIGGQHIYFSGAAPASE
jgi:hypothetical protein